MLLIYSDLVLSYCYLFAALLMQVVHVLAKLLAKLKLGN